MPASIDHTIFASATTITITPKNIGDLMLLVMATSGGGGNPYITSISDTQDNAWNKSILGTFGASSSYFTYGGDNFFASAFYAYASATSANTITPVWNGGAPGSKNLWVADCVNISSSTPVLANIHNEQSAPGTGTDAVTTSGGTGSGTIASAPALLVGWVTTEAVTPTVSHGTGYTESLGDTGYEVEYQRVASTGTYNATATISSAAGTVIWMIALAEAAGGVISPQQLLLGVG